jgi:hypothetical protein
MPDHVSRLQPPAAITSRIAPAPHPAGPEEEPREQEDEEDDEEDVRAVPAGQGGDRGDRQESWDKQHSRPAMEVVRVAVQVLRQIGDELTEVPCRRCLVAAVESLLELVDGDAALRMVVA